MISKTGINMYHEVVIFSFGLGLFMLGLGAGINTIQPSNSQILILVGLFLFASSGILNWFCEKLTGWTLEWQSRSDKE
jgi:hypothetical protein